MPAIVLEAAGHPLGSQAVQAMRASMEHGHTRRHSKGRGPGSLSGQVDTIAPNMIVVEPRAHPLQQLPDLTDRLIAMGAMDDYVKYKKDYLKWRKVSERKGSNELGRIVDEPDPPPAPPMDNNFVDDDDDEEPDDGPPVSPLLIVQWGRSMLTLIPYTTTRPIIIDAKAVLAEFITMALFVFIACGSACSNGASDSASRFMVAMCFGMSILVLAYSVAHHSGGHINCAVTLALVVAGITPWHHGLLFTIAQMLGSMLGASLLLVVYDCDEDQTGSLGSNIISDNFSYGQAFLAEALCTFMLVFAIFENAVTSQSSSGKNACLVIGFAVFIAHTILLPIDGCSINPTRSFGPAVVSALRMCDAQHARLGLRDLWMMWVGPSCGGVLAALVYMPFSHRVVLAPQDVDNNDESNERDDSNEPTKDKPPKLETNDITIVKRERSSRIEVTEMNEVKKERSSKFEVSEISDKKASKPSKQSNLS